jgi:hypothetical protein
MLHAPRHYSLQVIQATTNFNWMTTLPAGFADGSTTTDSNGNSLALVKAGVDAAGRTLWVSFLVAYSLFQVSYSSVQVRLPRHQSIQLHLQRLQHQQRKRGRGRVYSWSCRCPGILLRSAVWWHGGLARQL